MSESRPIPTPPEPAEVIDAVRVALVNLLPPEDLAHVDLDALDSQTPLLGLPVDSAVLMALMNELETRFTVYIEEEAAFGFGTLGDVSDYIGNRISERARRFGQT